MNIFYICNVLLHSNIELKLFLQEEKKFDEWVVFRIFAFYNITHKKHQHIEKQSIYRDIRLSDELC